MIDWNTILAPIFGFIAGAAGSIFAPWVNWGIEKRRARLAAQREVIVKWRQMIQSIAVTRNEAVARGEDSENRSVATLLESREDFYSLKPHLSQNTISNIYRPTIFLAGTTIDSSLSYILDDIARLEKKWRLV